MGVKIKASFKKAQKTYDGLSAIEAQLVDEERLHDRYVVVAIVCPHRVDLLADDATKSATIKFDHIEPLDGDAAAAAKELLMTAYRDRTGRDDDPQEPLFGVDGEVPEPSGEEILAERAERKAAAAGAAS